MAWLLRNVLLMDALPAGDEAWARINSAEFESADHYLRWFVRMRWYAIVIAFTLVFVSVKLTGLLPDVVWWPLLLTTTGLVGVNLLTVTLKNHGIRSEHLLHLQVYLDLTLLTILLHFSGGIENPLSLLPLVHVILSGIYLNRNQCFKAAIFAGLLFTFLCWAEWAHWIDHYTLRIFPHGEGEPIHAAHQTLFVASRVGLQWSLFLLTAYFVTTLAEQSKQNKRRAEFMARRALEERQLVERALDTTGTALRVVNADSQSVWTNNRWKEWFENGGNHDEEVVNGICLTEAQTLEDGECRTSEVFLNINGNEKRVYQITTAPLWDEERKIHEIVDLAQDVTQQKYLQAQMIRAGKMAAIGELASNVAHEVNNPIAIISAKARLLLSDYGDQISEKCREELTKIIRSSDKVAQIAQGLLSFSRPSLANRVLADINESIRNSLSMIEQRARKQNVAIHVALTKNIPRVPLNPNEMEQVFLNLFLNALDAMPVGGSLKISSGVSKEPPYVEVVVKDTGCGVPEDIRDRIFEPFFTTKEEGRGAGLGLSICLGLIKGHDGQIDVRNGGGASFIVKLPSGNAFE